MTEERRITLCPPPPDAEFPFGVGIFASAARTTGFAGNLWNGLEESVPQQPSPRGACALTHCPLVVTSTEMQLTVSPIPASPAGRRVQPLRHFDGEDLRGG